MSDNFKSLYLDAYWVVRAVLELAEYGLKSPHPLWSQLNELIEVCDTMEKSLNIANRTDSFKKETE